MPDTSFDLNYARNEINMKWNQYDISFGSNYASNWNGNKMKSVIEMLIINRLCLNPLVLLMMKIPWKVKMVKVVHPEDFT